MPEDKMMENAEPARKMESIAPLNQVSIHEPINEPIHTRALKKAIKRNEDAKKK